MKIKHKIISCLLALAILFNCLPPLHAETGADNEESARLEQLQKDYGSLDLNELYDTYKQVRILPEESPYFSKSYQELIDIYAQINDDIAFLWSQNPEYIRQKIQKAIRHVAVATAAVTVSAIAAYCVGAYLVASGFPITGELVSYVPLKTSTSATMSLKSAQVSIGAMKLAKLLKGGKKVKDIAKLSQTINRATISAKGMLLWTSIMTIDGIILRDSFAALDNSLQRVQKIQDESYAKYLPSDFAVTMNNLIEEANYFAPLFENDVEKAQKNLEQFSANFIDNFDDLDEEVKGPTQAEYVRIGKVITTIHVLELIRAELSDRNNPIRYDMASFDIFKYFFKKDEKEKEKWTEKLPYPSDNILYDREQLTNFLMPIHQALDQKAKDDREKVNEKFERGELHYSHSIL